MPAVRHIVEKPDDLQFLPCVHKRTPQRYATLPWAATIETAHGTMTGRMGDKLMLGADGQTLYVIEEAAWRAAYDDLSTVSI